MTDTPLPTEAMIEAGRNALSVAAASNEMMGDDEIAERIWQAMEAARTPRLVSEEMVAIPREAYDFLMGAGPLEGVWFGELNKGLPGAFWWRGVLASAAGWPVKKETQR